MFQSEQRSQLPSLDSSSFIARSPENSLETSTRVLRDLNKITAKEDSSVIPVQAEQQLQPGGKKERGLSANRLKVSRGCDSKNRETRNSGSETAVALAVPELLRISFPWESSG